MPHHFSLKMHTHAQFFSVIFGKIFQTNLPLSAPVKQLGDRHQYDVHRYDDSRCSEHQQLVFSIFRSWVSQV